jgi:hypothetical protein
MLPKILKIMTPLFVTDHKGKTLLTSIYLNKSRKNLPNFPTCIKFGVENACGSALFDANPDPDLDMESGIWIDIKKMPIHNTEKIRTTFLRQATQCEINQVYDSVHF